MLVSRRGAVGMTSPRIPGYPALRLFVNEEQRGGLGCAGPVSPRAEAEHSAGSNVLELSRKHGVSSTTLYKWRSRHDGVDVSELGRMRFPESENASLKLLLVDALLETARLRGLPEKNFRDVFVLC